MVSSLGENLIDNVVFSIQSHNISGPVSPGLYCIESATYTQPGPPRLMPWGELQLC